MDGSSLGGGYSVSPSPYTGHGTVDIEIEDDVVTMISSAPLLFHYPVESLIEQFGEPEGLYLAYGGGSTTCSTCEMWEPPMEWGMSYPVHILYPNQGLWFLMLVPASGMGCICPEMEVSIFCYYAPRSMQDALNDDDLTTLFGALRGASEADLVEWHGFGGGY
jgi:hypothetical protein